MCWLAISPPLKGEDTKPAEGCPRRWCKPAVSLVEELLLLVLLLFCGFIINLSSFWVF